MGKPKIKRIPQAASENYKCMKCSKEWNAPPGPKEAVCDCGSVYVEWINFKTDWYEDENWQWRRR